MALVKKSGRHEGMADVDPQSLEQVSLSPTQRVMANVATVAAERKTLRKEVTAVGVIDVAEPNYLHISMRFPGRLEKLYLGFTGQRVRKGDPVAEVYSPEAISAQQEYLLALESKEELHNVPERVRLEAEELLRQAREKLIRWGFTEEQVEKLGETRQVHQTVTMLSQVSGTVLKKNVDPQHYAMTGEDIYDVVDLSTVWIYLDVYEQDVRFIKPGQDVHITTEAYPGESFVGRVTFIDPVLQADTRTIRVRTEFANPDGKLRPNMYVRAQVKIPLVNALVVPASAVMTTGKRNVVWVETNPDAFEPRDVVIGTTTETYAEILNGVHAGEHVAETGGFLIDSESALRSPRAADVHAAHGVAQKEPVEPFARPSEYFREKEKHAENNEAAILVKGRYTPEVIHVRAGEPVTLRFYRDEDADCTNEVVFEDLGIRRRLPARETTTIVFTPKDTGEIAFSCGMGMVRGKLIVGK
jgi:Cu(I)/Ag(I) efflux system membrane fusion protein